MIYKGRSSQTGTVLLFFLLLLLFEFFTMWVGCFLSHDRTVWNSFNVSFFIGEKNKTSTKGVLQELVPPTAPLARYRIHFNMFGPLKGVPERLQEIKKYTETNRGKSPALT